eukprot:2406112-Prymnesium_polylepis.1
MTRTSEQTAHDHDRKDQVAALSAAALRRTHTVTTTLDTTATTLDTTGARRGLLCRVVGALQA